MESSDQQDERSVVKTPTTRLTASKKKLKRQGTQEAKLVSPESNEKILDQIQVNLQEKQTTQKKQLKRTEIAKPNAVKGRTTMAVNKPDQPPSDLKQRQPLKKKQTLKLSKSNKLLEPSTEMVKDSQVNQGDECYQTDNPDSKLVPIEQKSNTDSQTKLPVTVQVQETNLSELNGPSSDEITVPTLHRHKPTEVVTSLNVESALDQQPDSATNKFWRTKSSFKQWDQDEDKDAIDRILAVKKQNSGEDNAKFFSNLKRQFTQLVEENPPMPLLPKSVYVRNESPRFGSVQTFLKLTKFRGKDAGKSQFRLEESDSVEPVQFSQIPQGTSTSLRYIFQPISQYPGQAPTSVVPVQPARRLNKDFQEKREMQSAHREKEKDKPPFADQSVSTTARNNTQQRLKPGTQSPVNETQPDVQSVNNRMTAVGELVYQRHALDFKSVNKFQKRDFVLEENLLDVKKLLKNSNFVDKTDKPSDPEKKQLVRVNLEPYYTPTGPDDTTLIFESRFESGNLGAAVKVSDDDYHLLLQNDVNTGGHTQWFFFKVNNVKPGEVRFNLLNLCKPDSLYNQGMKVLVYSERLAASKDIGWHRGGTKISYYQNQIRKGAQANKFYYTHTFTYDFEFAHDSVYFAYCYPYTYTDMIEDLNKIMQDPAKSTFCKRQTLVETLAGNKCEMLTITARTNQETMPRRKGIVITARVHPGESNGSWMMKGVLNFLTSTEDPAAELLRQHFIFKIVPMLNPDGVINGNYRCSLAGCDLNRRWKAPSKILHPTIYSTKQMILSFAKERELSLFCDLHGHSRRKNIFMYGCNNPQFPEENRIFPFILGSICPFFIYNNSRFGNQRSKEATARMALFNEVKTTNVFTLEASFQGNDQGQFKNYHFSTDNLMQTGADLCRSILVHHTIVCPNEVVDSLMLSIHEIYMFDKAASEEQNTPDKEVELMGSYKEKINELQEAGVPINTLQIKKALLKVLRQHQDVQTDQDETQSSAGSDNAPSEDNLKQEEIAEVVPIEGAKPLMKKPVQQQSASPPKRRQTIKEKPETAQKLRIQPQRVGVKQGSREKKREGDSAREDRRSDEEKEDAGKGLGSLNKDGATADIVTDENVVHKKKLKKNVESRDACTQTERSDYMLIKQRQKQKEILQMAKQGNLPPGMTAQQLVNSFMNIQSSSNPVQFKNLNTVPPLSGTKSLNTSTGNVQSRAPNSNNARQQMSANAYVHPNAHLSLPQAAPQHLKNNTAGVQGQRAKPLVGDANESLLRAQQLGGKPVVLKLDGSNTQSAWNQKVTNQSYISSMGKGSNPNDNRLQVPPVNGQLAVDSMQRLVGSQHGPRTVSIGAHGPNQPVDGKGSWESAIQQQRVMNGALNQWIQMKNREGQQLQPQIIKGRQVNPSFQGQRGPEAPNKIGHQTHSNSFLVKQQNQQAYPQTESFPSIQANSLSKKKKQKSNFKGPSQTLYQHYSDMIGSREQIHTKLPNSGIQMSMLGTSVDGISKKSLKDQEAIRGILDSQRKQTQQPIELRSSSQATINPNQPQRKIKQREQTFAQPTELEQQRHNNINTMSAEFQSQQKLASVLENSFIKQTLEQQTAQQAQRRTMLVEGQMSEESKGGNQIYIYAPQGTSNTSTQLVPPSSKQVKSTPLKGSPSAHKTKQLNSQSIDVTKIQIQSRNHGQQEGPTSKSGGPSFKKQRSPLTGSNEAFNESGRVRYGVQLAGLNSETEFHNNGTEHFSNIAPDSGSGVKINIVNVHNEYNISNNIIIQGGHPDQSFQSSQTKPRNKQNAQTTSAVKQ